MIREHIQQSDEFQEIAVTQQQNQQGGGQSPRTTQSGADTVAGSLAPLLDLEKTDVEFWLQVAQTILLFMILRELGGA